MDDIVVTILYLLVIIAFAIVRFVVYPLIGYLEMTLGGINSIADFLCIISKLLQNKNDYKKYYRDCNYFRDIPNKGNICVSYFLLTEFKCWKTKENHIISAMILKMILDKNIQILNEETMVENDELKLLLKTPPKDDGLKELYDILDYATEDEILETNELREYIKTHYEIYDNLLYVLKQNGKKILIDKNYIVDKICYDINDLNDDGKNELEEVYGFRKYLDDFTLINERGIKETIIWEDLIVYATMFGLGDKIYKDIKNICPKNIEEIIGFGRMQSYAELIDDTMKTNIYDNWWRLCFRKKR